MTDLESQESYWQWHDRHGFTRVINVSGTMTALGASLAPEPVRTATMEAMDRFVKIHELQAQASRTIATLTGSEAGCVTASASAAMTLCVAGCMTGLNPARAAGLPLDPGPRSEVAIQLGHMCAYGAPVSTAIEIAGARIKPVGQSTLAMDYQLEAALNEHTAAAMYVVSHHVVHYGQIPFQRFVHICHAHQVPVIVDAASEYDLTGFIDAGADLVIYSAHKFLGGPTAGIIAGRRDLVRATYLQNTGIGRGFKVGKESIAGTIAAMEQWMVRDHAGVRAMETSVLAMWEAAIANLPGIRAERAGDPTHNPLERLQVNVNAAQAGASAATFARVLSQQRPAIIVRNHEVELGYFQLDPCNLAPGQAIEVAATLKQVLSQGASYSEEPDDLHSARNGGVDAYLNWLTN